MSTIEAVLRLEDRSQMAMHAVRLSAREISSGSEFAGEDFHQLAARYLHYHLLTWIEGKYLIAAKQEFGIETYEFAESYYQLMKMDVEGSLQMAEKGDYREVKRILLERAQSAIGHTENESQVVFGRRLERLALSIKDTGKPFVSPIAPWEDEVVVLSYQKEKEEKLRDQTSTE